MSIIPKVWNLCNFNNIIRLVTSNIYTKLQCGGTIFERFYSKRFTIGKNCGRCPPKSKCAKKARSCNKNKRSKEKKPKPKSSKSKIVTVCTPFEKQEMKPPKPPAPKKEKRECKAGMIHPCKTADCPLGRKQWSTNECPQQMESPKVFPRPCPRGDWERGD